MAFPNRNLFSSPPETFTKFLQPVIPTFSVYYPPMFKIPN